MRIRDWPVHHFGVVETGVLYRSGQPDRLGWRVLRAEYGIRTVIDLRPDLADEPWAVAEREFCRRSGIELVKMPIGPERLTDAQLQRLLDVVTDPTRQPVLVHCEHGSSRTGVVVAAYRIVADGWSFEAAIAESRRYKPQMNRGYAAYLKQLANETARGPAEASDGLPRSRGDMIRAGPGRSGQTDARADHRR